MKMGKFKMIMLSNFIILFLCVNSFAGNLKRSYEFGDKEIFEIMQNDQKVGYAMVGFESGHVTVSVINITGSRKWVKVECELNHHSSASNVDPGSLKVDKSIGLIASKPQKFKVTRDFCGWGAIYITFK